MKNGAKQPTETSNATSQDSNNTSTLVPQVSTVTIVYDTDTSSLGQNASQKDSSKNSLPDSSAVEGESSAKSIPIKIIKETNPNKKEEDKVGELKGKSLITSSPTPENAQGKQNLSALTRQPSVDAQGSSLNSRNQVHESSPVPKDTYVIKFHVWAPPEYQYDGSFEFVVTSSVLNWDISKAIPLQIYRYLRKGFL